MFTYAVDIMGGDLGPRVALKACRRFLRFRRDVNLIVTTTAEFESEARSILSLRKNNIRIRVCENAICMDDKPAQMLRKGLTSTMAAALQECAEGRALGMVSAGNTGALLVLSRHILGMVPGIDRPALATLLPTRKAPLLMLDLGANLAASPEQLVQFAALGTAWFESQNDTTARLGLLNIGRESAKGTDAIKQTADYLAQALPDRYLGFYEGDDIYKGELDVLVTDGFAGNITLKASEGLSEWMQELIHKEFRQHWLMRWFAFLWLPAVRNIEKRISPARHGGALLLGLKGVVVKTHGKSDARAFRYALKYLHKTSARFDLQKISQCVEKTQQSLPSCTDD